jgi:phage gp36-like protein
MAYLTQAELKTHIYGENVTAITRSDATIVTAAIDAAIAEAKGYLNAYDIATIFAATGTARNALLLVFVKDIAAWHLVVLSNAGVELQLRQDRYERAIAWLKAVQKGEIVPDLPEAVDDDGLSTGEPILYGSNTKRTQHF